MSTPPAKLNRSFWWLNVTQFAGALNDNYFKLLLVFCLISIKGAESSETILASAGAVFALPFLLFSAAAGTLADRLGKRNIIVGVKAFEVVVMLTGLLAFFLRSEPLLYGVLFMMALQSTVFSPAKYGIIPELIGQEGLSRANSFLTAFTYLAIILGTGFAPLVSDLLDGRYVIAGGVAALIAVGGFMASRSIRPTEPAGSSDRPSVLFIRDIFRTLRTIGDGYLLTAVIAQAYFLMIAAFVQINIIPYGITELGLSKEQAGYLFLVAAMGIGLGALSAGRLSGRHIELGVVPVGAIGLMVSCVLLALAPVTLPGTCLFMVLLGVSAGLFVVPLSAFVQFRSPRAKLGKILAASNFLGWIGVLAASGIVMTCSKMGFSARQAFQAAGWLTLILTVASVIILPDFLTRFAAMLIVKTFYRIRVRGQEHIPVQGPALMVSNHVSWVDALLIGATQQRRVRFMMFREIYDNRWLKPIFKMMGVIPVSFKDSPKRIVESLQAARKSLDDGFMVCIFAEGSITRTGMMQEFKTGMERIVRGGEIPVIPVYLGGVWGSIFSYAHGQPLSRWPRKIPYDVDICVGKPMPSTCRAHDVRQAVMELSSAYFEYLKPGRCSLGEDFIRTARMNWGRTCMTDTTGKRFTFGRALTGAQLLRSALRPYLEDVERLGILLPTTCGAGLANAATLLEGKVPVNLNYTASKEALASAIRQSGIRSVLTSRQFLERLGSLEAPEGSVFIEDLVAGIGPWERLKALLRSRFLPRRFLRSGSCRGGDQLATIIFSSGSTGVPKGIMLSHHNIQSNIEGFRMVLRPTPNDNIASALPFFHSFGFTCTLWLPLISGFSVSYHPNPMEGDKFTAMVRENRSTLLITTPTFLLSYIRRAKREDFASLRLVVTGAEKLKKKIADAFEDRFGIRPLEGYGATELSPVVSVNIPSVTVGGVTQEGQREGSVGHPVPGIAVRAVDPETGETLPLGEPGLLLVKGPNVMMGYLDQPEATAEVMQDGWYVTGDIARVELDGFVTLTDRLSRFSKIGGEMIPHTSLEDQYYEGLDSADRVLAVTSVPDERKGERLVVLYTEEAGTPEGLHALIDSSEVPNLWKPSPGSYYKVDAIPILGSGKLDILKLRELALRCSGG